MIMRIDRIDGASEMARRMPVWFKFWIDDWAGGTVGMSSEEKGAYLELLILQFRKGVVTLEEAYRVTDCSDETIRLLLSTKFELHRTTQNEVTYQNERMAEIRDESIERNETLRQNGLKGGRPTSSKKPKGYSQKTKRFSTENQTGTGTGTGTSKKKKKGVPPTLDDVKAYCQERKNKIDPDAFVDFYAAQGWQLSNGRPMKDWKAAIRTWERRDSNQSKPLSEYKRKMAEAKEQRERQEAAAASRREANAIKAEYRESEAARALGAKLRDVGA